MKPTRTTNQKRIILEELRKLKTHPTAADIYDIARRQLPRLSLGTVYRNLDALTRSGEIRRIASAGAEARFDGNPSQHYHVRCVRCGRLDDVEHPKHDMDLVAIQRSSGYDIHGFELEFFGICPMCQSGDNESGDWRNITNHDQSDHAARRNQ